MEQQLNFKRILVTPSLAEDMLKLNTKNRAISQPTVNRYVSDITNGRWLEDTGELIKVSKTGQILDGQHRLMAVSKSGESVWFHIAYGLDDSVFSVLDTGKLRNASDTFRVAGVLQSNSIPSILSTFNTLEDGRFGNSQKDQKRNNAELLEQYSENPNFWYEVSTSAHSWYTLFAKILSPSQIGGTYAHLHGKNSELANEFMAQLCTGKAITNEVISLLRNKLIIDKTSNRKLSPSFKLALIIKSWNYFVKGSTVKVLRYDPLTESYPLAISGK